MARTILITDGMASSPRAPSGPRHFAESIAARQDGQVVYVETTEFLDDAEAPEVPDRAATWKTILAPRDLIGALAAELDARTVLVDGLGHWVANRLLDLGDPDDEQWRDEVNALGEELVEEAGRILRLARVAGWTLILMSNDLGSEAHTFQSQPLGRAFRDIIHDLNHAIFSAADGVFTVISGIPVELKRPQEVVV